MPHARAHAMLVERLRHPPPSARAPASEPTVVLSIKPHYADLIARGQKRVEFRRRFPRSFDAGRAIFYVSSPVRAIVMTARVASVRRDTPAALWREFAATGGTARAAFDEYFTAAETGAALLLEDVATLAKPIALTDRRLRSLDFRPPQSLTVIDADSPLAKLIDRAPVIRGVAPHLFA